MPDYSLYLVTDSRGLSESSFLQTVEAAIAGGVRVVQLREKEASTRAFFEKAKAVKALTQAANIPLLINDRLDIALAVDAEGLHIGQSDLPYREARRLLGADKIIGLSVENKEQARAAQELDVDYLGVSPVFSTPTKKDIAQPFGLEGLRELADFSRHPLVAIGGIKPTNAASVLQAGAQGLAVVSAIMGSLDAGAAARHFQKIISSPFS